MDSSKQQYLDSVRSNTAYPVYRAVVQTIAFLGYLLAGFYALAAVIMGLTTMFGSSFLMGAGILILGAIAAALVFMLARCFKEGALILADMGDSTVETNARAHSTKAAG